MKINQQQNRMVSNDQINFENTIINQNHYLQPYERFQAANLLSIKIHFIRFFAVTAIYYWADLFLAKNQNDSAQPWNSLLYFLAIMIEIIKGIGDYSLKNMLKSQKPRLIQHHEAIKNGNIQTNICLKSARYQDYLCIYRMIKLFKYTHPNYSSAFSISKSMHFFCTFVIFGWMSLSHQSPSQPIPSLILSLFLLSIYITSIRQMEKKGTERDNLDVRRNFSKWRAGFLRYQKVGTVFLAFALVIGVDFNVMSVMAFLVLFINGISYYVQNIIIENSSSSIASLKRQQTNPYSILSHAASSISILFKITITTQRIFLLFLWFAYAYSSLQTFPSCIYLISLVILSLNQRDCLKLMTILRMKFLFKDEMECSICLKDLREGQDVNVLPCSKEHVFHVACFRDWTGYKKECPLCRYPLTDYL